MILDGSTFQPIEVPEEPSAEHSESEDEEIQDAHDSAHEDVEDDRFEGLGLKKTPFGPIVRETITKEDKDLHKKASQHVPHHLPERRYWAAVLVHKVKPTQIKGEKDFIWLKGSRVRSSGPTVAIHHTDVSIDQHGGDNLAKVPRCHYGGETRNHVLWRATRVRSYAGRVGSLQ